MNKADSIVKINACRNATSNSSIVMNNAKGTDIPATPALSSMNINDRILSIIM